MPHYSDTAKASPSTIWETCFSHMKFDIWDVDVKEVLDVSGPCQDGTTFVFHMNDGKKVDGVLSDVTPNKCLTFSGGMLGGTLKFKGTIQLEPVESDSDKAVETKVDYDFHMGGVLGPVVNLMQEKAIVEGTEKGLENIVKLSEQAEKTE